MSTIRFAATKLAGTNKKGILPPDENGYYTMPIGGLNVYNSAGAYYTLEGAKELFEQSSIFMRRIKNGNLKGELGHPKMLPGMNMNDFVQRLLTIEETNVCCHFKEIWLDMDYGKNNPHLKNPKMVAIMAKVKPSGPRGQVLKDSLENPDENVNFSIRALSQDYYERGQLYKVLKNIVCFDVPTEPGISTANKWDSPSLENLEESIITKSSVSNVLSNIPSMVTMEDTKIMAIETLKLFDNGVKASNPLYTKW